MRAMARQQQAATPQRGPPNSNTYQIQGAAMNHNKQHTTSLIWKTEHSRGSCSRIATPSQASSPASPCREIATFALHAAAAAADTQRRPVVAPFRGGLLRWGCAASDSLLLPSTFPAAPPLSPSRRAPLVSPPPRSGERDRDRDANCARPRSLPVTLASCSLPFSRRSGEVASARPPLLQAAHACTQAGRQVPAKNKRNKWHKPFCIASFHAVPNVHVRTKCARAGRGQQLMSLAQVSYFKHQQQ